MKSAFLTLFTLATLCICFTDGARILFLAPLGSTSHINAFMPVMKELGKRGHEVIHVTHSQSKKSLEGVTEVFLEEVGGFLKSRKESQTLIGEESLMTTMIPMMKRLFVEGCELYLKDPYVQDLISGKVAKPDLVIASLFFSECSMGIIHKLQVPFIYFSSAGFFPWTISSLRAPEDPTYCPLATSESGNRMDFKGRVENTIMSIAFTLMRNFYWAPGIKDIVKQHLGDVPPFEDIEKTVSLIILNSHFSMDLPRPLTPNIIEAGGMHINEAKPLPKDLEDWFQSSGDDGVVYFSLGALFPGSLMPEKFRRVFIEAFSRIPQKVIWKWEKDDMPDLPPNVRISKWLPQQDILGHPKLKVFITHGGLLSTMETTYFGVPVIGMPIANDQKMNMKSTEASGGGLTLNWNELSADRLVDAINELITNPEYQNNVSIRSAIAQDRDMHPLDKAIYWIEYVIRHKGAHHLKPGSMYLSDFAYYKLDIYLFFHALVAILLIGTLLCCRCICRKICKPKEKTVQKKKQESKNKKQQFSKKSQ